MISVVYKAEDIDDKMTKNTYTEQEHLPATPLSRDSMGTHIVLAIGTQSTPQPYPHYSGTWKIETNILKSNGASLTELKNLTQQLESVDYTHMKNITSLSNLNM